jgi:hypothetical protein
VAIRPARRSSFVDIRRLPSQGGQAIIGEEVEMDMSDQASLLQIQTGLFAALVGVLAAKGAASRNEFAEALEILARHEKDSHVAGYFQHMSEELRGSGQKERPFLKLVVGGLDSDASSIPA